MKNRPGRINGSGATQAPHQIIVVGGGAAGLELATTLGDSLGKRGIAVVTLIDRARTHVWKPKLHEVAAGSMEVGAHEVSYSAQAHWHHFRYRIGDMVGIDRGARKLLVAASYDDEGRQVTPARSFPYDTLVIAIGSETNDFGTPGVNEHALKLETTDDARRFNRRLVNGCIRANALQQAMEIDGSGTDAGAGPLRVAIIGGGATGVELSAELHRTTREVVAYGLDRVNVDKDFAIHLIEASDRVLPALTPKISAEVETLLKKLGVQVHTSARVAAVLADGVNLADGRRIDAELVVWAAGVKAPDVLKNLAGLETNRINQLVVRPTLQATLDDDIFAIGDCAACPMPDGNGNVPPRAQAAHQQASHMLKQIKRRIAGEPLQDYHYRDFGSLVSLSDYSAVGDMKGGLIRGSLNVHGLFARTMYQSLYKMHEVALHGYTKVTLDTLTRMITRRTEPHVKVH
ncbi:NAD(P)/FAD-dependent oxidoreductase [Burkholderia sp. GS2Y]|uniref:NAD(P)/FAD-dependent oxidoreductase n=1 Tax=Burkholderia theae TaxID=3143496 RepID=A0ABU9WJC8_9BURK